MFKALRRMIVPIIIIVLFFFAGMIVLEWGMGLSSRQNYQNTNLAAIINGEEITWQQYNRTYNNLAQAEIQKAPDQELSENQRRQIHLNAWQQIVHDRLLMQQVKNFDIIVSADEIYSFLKYSPPPELQASPSFQTDGNFDYTKYVNAMADPQAEAFWASIEPIIISEIEKIKIQEMVIQAAHVSEDEVKRAYIEKFEEVDLGLVNISFARFSKPPPTSTEDEVRAFFEERRDDYYLDEKRGLNIAILEKSPKPYDWEISYNLAIAIYDSIQAGSDFAEMARKYSDDVTSEDGGDLGWFPAGQMVPEFDKIAFSLQADDVSQPVRTQFGWHIIKVHERKEVNETPPGKDQAVLVKKARASHVLIKADVSQETLDELYNRIERFNVAAVNTGFEKAARDLKMPVRRTSTFFRGKNIQFIGSNPQVNNFAFESELNAISDLMENNSSFFVVQLSEIDSAGPASFEDSKEKVQIDIVRYKVLTLCMDTANAIWDEFKAGTPIEKAAENHAENIEILESVSRTGWVPQLRREPALIGAAFSMESVGDMTPPVKFGQGVAIFKLINRTTPDLTDYNSKRDSIYSAILNYKQQNIYEIWFESLVRSSEVVNNVEKALLENPDFL